MRKPIRDQLPALPGFGKQICLEGHRVADKPRASLLLADFTGFRDEGLLRERSKGIKQEYCRTDNHDVRDHHAPSPLRKESCRSLFIALVVAILKSHVVSILPCSCGWQSLTGAEADIRWLYCTWRANDEPRRIELIWTGNPLETGNGDGSQPIGFRLKTKP